MAVNLNFENETNLYTIRGIPNVSYPCIYSGIDLEWVVRTTHQFGWSYKLGNYAIQFEEVLTSWRCSVLLSVSKTYQQITIGDSKGWVKESSDSIVYFMLNSNVYIAAYSYEYGQRYYKDSDRFLGCGIHLTSLNRGEWISLKLSSESDDHSDRLFVHYSRFGIVAKAVSWDYDPETDWDGLVPFDVI